MHWIMLFQQFYRDARRELPNEGVRFTYDGILFKVIEVNALLNKIRISGEDGRILDMDAARLKYLDSHWTVIEEDNWRILEEETTKRR